MVPGLYKPRTTVVQPRYRLRAAWGRAAVGHGGQAPVDDADLTGALYGAAADGLWQRPVEAVLARCAGSSGSLMILGADGAAPSLLAMPGYSPTALRLYAEHFHAVDLWAKLGRLRPSLRAVIGAEHVPDAEFERSEVWTDYAREHVGAFHLLGAVFSLGDGRNACIGLHRLRGQEPFAAGERAWLDALLPHVRSALRLERRLRAQDVAGTIASSVLDRLACGLVVARQDGTVLLANAAAVSLGDRGGPLRLGDGHRPLAATARAAGPSLGHLVRLAAGGGPGGVVHLPRDAGPGVVALVTPLPAGLLPDQPARGLALLVLTDLRDGAPDVAGLLRQLYGLTPAETALAVALADGLRLAEFAEARRVRLTTVRSQIRAVLDKTGCRRQSELVRLVTRLGMLAPAPGPQVVR